MKHFLILLLASGLLLAQSNRINRIIEFEPDGSDQIKNFEKLLGPSSVGFVVEPSLKLINIWTDAANKEKLDEAEQLIRRYYKPKISPARDKNVEVTLYVLNGKQGTAEPSDAPSQLAPVLQQIKQSTGLGTFKILEIQILRVREGNRVEASGVFAWPDTNESASPQYQFKADVAIANTNIQLNALKFGCRMPIKHSENQYQFREVGINSSFDLKPNQIIVVGKSNASSKDGAIILVLSAKIVD